MVSLHRLQKIILHSPNAHVKRKIRLRSSQHILVRTHFTAPLMINGINFNDPQVKLLEEDTDKNYKLYHQRMPYNKEDSIAYDKFHDEIWYGSVGDELTVKFLNLREVLFEKELDLFTMRRYDNPKIIMGSNAIRRTNDYLSNIFPTKNMNNNSNNNMKCNVVLRLNTVISPDFQSMGYGKIVRKYSSFLEDKFMNDKSVGDCGISMTGVQNANVRSQQLQIKSGMIGMSETTGLIVARSKKFLSKYNFDGTSNKDYNISIIDTKTSDKDKVMEMDAAFENFNKLSEEQLRLNNVITFGINKPSARSLSKDSKIYTINNKTTGEVICGLQCKGPMRMAMQPPNHGLESVLLPLANKIVPDYAPAPFEEFEMLTIFPIYLKGLKNNGDIEDKNGKEYFDLFVKLIEYCMKEKGCTQALLHMDHLNPFIQLGLKNKNKLCSFIGANVLSQEKVATLFVKTSNFPQEYQQQLKEFPLLTIVPLHEF